MDRRPPGRSAHSLVKGRAVNVVLIPHAVPDSARLIMLHEIDTSVSQGLSLRRFGWQMLILVSAFLLISMGGAILAAPVTLPLLWFSLRRPDLSCPWKITAAVVLPLTAAESTWAVAYLTLGESKPLIWLLPLGAFALAASSTRRAIETVRSAVDGAPLISESENLARFDRS